ncbi:FAD-dependent oxidoreductase [Kitasatospora sp. NPDC088351]|uniref:FAD-dependent oxidoreductase n=1 Tax=Kitasatospora sp. NPDC088351 TaxID=3155180 RepID=UPI003423456D
MPRTSVAVIGSGVGGLTAAHLLQRSYDVTLYEAAPRIGGHAETHTVPDGAGGSVAVDTAVMMVHARGNPHLMRLFDELGVTTRPLGEITLSVVCEECGFGNPDAHDLHRPPPQPQAVPAAAWQRVTEQTKRFSDDLTAALGATAADRTLHELIDAGEYGDYVVEHVIMPVMVTMGLVPADHVRRFPLGHLFETLDHNGVLAGDNGWRSVVGGTASYVERIAARLTTVLRSTPVRSVRRTARTIDVRDATGTVRSFDKAVIATHPRHALDLLADPSGLETRILGVFDYVANPGVLHTDASVLPTAPGMRRTHNYRQRSCRPVNAAPSLSIDLNRLQGIASAAHHIASYNDEARRASPATVIAPLSYEHPAWTPESAAAQRLLPLVSDHRLAFAGAYHHAGGYHEDGCLSGVRAAASLGVPW